jgi:hypothetical protein
VGARIVRAHPNLGPSARLTFSNRQACPPVDGQGLL